MPRLAAHDSAPARCFDIVEALLIPRLEAGPQKLKGNDAPSEGYFFFLPFSLRGDTGDEVDVVDAQDEDGTIPKATGTKKKKKKGKQKREEEATSWKKGSTDENPSQQVPPWDELWGRSFPWPARIPGPHDGLLFPCLRRWTAQDEMHATEGGKVHRGPTIMVFPLYFTSRPTRGFLLFFSHFLRPDGFLIQRTASRLQFFLSFLLCFFASLTLHVINAFFILLSVHCSITTCLANDPTVFPQLLTCYHRPRSPLSSLGPLILFLFILFILPRAYSQN